MPRKIFLGKFAGEVRRAAHDKFPRKFPRSVFVNKWRNYHDSRGGTDTPGPGESASAIRFIGTCIFQ